MRSPRRLFDNRLAANVVWYKSVLMGIPLTQVLLSVVVLVVPGPPILTTPDHPIGDRKPLGCKKTLCRARQSSGSTGHAVQQVSLNCGSDRPAPRHYMLCNLSQGDTQIGFFATRERKKEDVS